MKILYHIFSLYNSINMDTKIFTSKYDTKEYWCNKCYNHSLNTRLCNTCVKTIGIPSNYKTGAIL